MQSQEIYHKWQEIFGQDPHIQEIIPCEDLYLPPIDSIGTERFTKSNQLTKEKIRVWLEAIYDDVQLPYVLDNFFSVEERDKWRRKVGMDKGLEVWDLLNRNALRPMIFTSIGSKVSVLKERGGGNLPLADEIIEASYGDEMDSYHKMSKTERIEYVRQFKQKVAKFLQHLAT